LSRSGWIGKSLVVRCVTVCGTGVFAFTSFGIFVIFILYAAAR
jgi:hypothetical protein